MITIANLQRIFSVYFLSCEDHPVRYSQTSAKDHVYNDCYPV